MKTYLPNDETLRPKVIEYVQKNGSITNRQCRELLGIGYDQAISLFNKMIETGQLIRVGKTSGIRYLLPDSNDQLSIRSNSER
jgi:predicted HTH transcriptional regulator